ncbi:hypothetical protein DR64_5468 [Paraburkholderia xenovorans LB400]|uniref:Uncharacterized protein n=1 Tax=Paraburkholderia xenovorans (strain LB400) TaxID=266265 RepID=Q13JC1_PARXL|nr:hypothetical protein [Paraburkholderia xenovorans]ABE35818.1 hypothetical protein Bxe_B0117 [Paraburkholderia xenovorans LB400]AIP36811.1 hypothetical protein DR64_5468 [Paraburkholderia xenovorans LB400]
MSLEAARMAALQAVYPDARLMADGTKEFVILPALHIQVGEREYVLDALLLPSSEPGGYPTRLYLTQQIAERQTIGGKAGNWTCESIAGKAWYTWSWTGVPSSLPLMDMLLAHLRALR